MRTLLLFLLTSTPAFAGEIYKDSERHFQFHIPDGWFVVPQAELDAMVASVRQTGKGDQSLQYICCLRRIGSSPGEFPSIVLQDIPRTTRYNTWDDVEATFRKDLKQPLLEIQNENRPLLKSLELNTTYCDRAKYRVLMTLTMEAQGQGRFREIAMSHVGSERMVVLHCWEEDRKFEASAPTFERISDSFQYDDGYSFQPASAPGGSKIGNLKYGVWLACLLGAMAIYLRRRR